MDEPWKVYYDELHDRAADIVDQEWNRDEDLGEAAHEAYAATADRLLNQLDWWEENALGITKAFNRAVKVWIEEGVYDWDDLIEQLEAAQMEWESTHEMAG